MAIPAKRFRVLDEETNMAVADFFSADHKDIFNSVNNTYKEISKDIEDFMANMEQELGIDELLSTIDDAMRITRDTLADISDTIEMTLDEVDSLLKDLADSNPLIAIALSGLKADCKKTGSGKSPYGKPYKPSIDCNGRKRRANARSKCYGQGGRIGDLLSGVTGSDFGSIFKDLNKIIGSIMALANMGYDLNMCGVFSALAAHFDIGVNPLTRAATGILGNLTSTSNMLGVLDLANGVGNLHVGKENPNAVWDISKAYRRPSEFREYDVPSMGERMFGAFDLYDDGWSESEYDDLPSISRLHRGSDEFREDLGISNYNQIFGEDDLEYVPDDDDMFMRNAIIMS